MEISVSEMINEVLKKEGIPISELATRVKREPWRVTLILKEDKEMRSKTWVEIAAAIGYQLNMVPKNPEKETILLDAEENAPLKVLNRIMVFSEVKRADIIQELGISRQAMSQLLRKNTDILANRFVQIASIIGYDVKMVKSEITIVK